MPKKCWWIWNYSQFYDLCEAIMDIVEERNKPDLTRYLAQVVAFRIIGRDVMIEQRGHQIRNITDMIMGFWFNAIEIALSFEECDVYEIYWIGDKRYKYTY